MNNNQNKATLKRVLRGLLVVGVIVAVVGVGVYFYFSDVEESPGNKITAGTLDLSIQETAEIKSSDWGKINDEEPICTAADETTGEVTCHVEISNIAPTDTGTIVWTLQNVGDLRGYLTVVAAVSSDNGTDTEPELTAVGEEGNLDLSDMVTVILTKQVSGDEGNPDYLVGSKNVENGLVEPGLLKQVEDAFNGEDDVPMDESTTSTYTLVWELPNTNSTFDNLAQGDTSTINLTFTLNQVENQGR